MKIVYTNEAESDIEYLIANISQKRISEIEKDILRLETTPDIGSHLNARIKTKTPYRYLVCNVYLIFYILHDDWVEIVRIMDGRQDWQSLFNV